NDQSYTELLEDAISRIPLYGSEWTNFNPSDPGVTILQNLTAFNYLQQTAINTVTDAIKFKLLALLGFSPEKARPAELLAAFSGAQEMRFCKYRKFLSQDTVFEIAEDVLCRPWGQEAMYCEREGVYSDVTNLLDRSLGVGAVAVFGSPVREGSSLCCVLNGKPNLAKEQILYAAVLGEEERNPFEADANRPFAELVWQVYTENGWENMEYTDRTHGFLVSGEIVLKPAPSLEPAVFGETPVAGYALRCTLLSHEYDRTPRLRALTANLMRFVQRDTMSAMYVVRGGASRVLAIDPAYPHICVYGRENAAAPYRAYKNVAEQQVCEEGDNRFFVADRLEDGTLRFRFDEAGFGVPPGEGEADLIVVCCTEEMERARSLGPVFGYIDQELDIDLAGNIIPDDFVLMLETTALSGERSYTFVRPDEPSPDGFVYELLPGRHKICVRRPEIGRECRAYIASCAMTLGADGNVREENTLEALVPEGAERSGTLFVNPAPGRGGCTAETLANLRSRFSACIKTPWTAVTASDYETIVLSAPGLCIHKVKALPIPSENLVQIVVKPRGEERFPGLSASYIRRITELLASRSMLTSRFAPVQPQYLPIDVKGSIYVKSRFADARADIERALAEALDFVSSDAEFGTPVLFDKVFGAIAALPCVLTIIDLALTPGSRGLSVMRGPDIIPEGRCLCYPGRFSIEVNARADR
ncbi:MAG: baseplate J/gp47 family protein, partial [Clostridiales Family XIII bacterium]|nr:baseplate J/gp47 family protein [Clostridiales Family XIII bacterium]